MLKVNIMSLAPTEAADLKLTAGNEVFQAQQLISSDRIQDRIAVMGEELSAHYANLGTVHVITVLSGAMRFGVELSGAMQDADPSLVMTDDQVKLNSYSGMASSGVVRSISEPHIDITGRHVLVAEDIIDSGLTLRWLVGNLKRRGAATIEVAAAFRKEVPHRTADFLGSTAIHAGFEIPDRFVVGYGLDYDGYFRNHSALYALRRDSSA